MRGPIDYIIVGFDGNNFDGSILSALEDAIDKNIIAIVSLALIVKDQAGSVNILDLAQAADKTLVVFAAKYKANRDLITQDDIDEVADLLENNTSAGLLVVEQLWAKPLKAALIKANGVLIAEGRIHPEAAAELNDTEEGA